MSGFKEFRILIVDDNPAIHQDFKKFWPPTNRALT